MLKHHTPGSIIAPFARYSHTVEVDAGAKLLLCSGQLGIDPHGHIPADAGEQAALCFENIRAILEAAGLGPQHIVRIWQIT